MNRRRRVAILGAGITGCSAAVLLARTGHEVHLFDDSPAPMSAASRWNEGKVHLGFLYAADPSRRTANRVLDGGLAFGSLVEELIGVPLADAVTGHDDTYVVHRDSVVGPEHIADYFSEVMRHIAEHPDSERYLINLRGQAVRQLSPTELGNDYNTDLVVAGFTVPERSVSTEWVADRLCAAVDAEPSVVQHRQTRVSRVRDRDGASSWDVVAADGSRDGPFDWVVNATWQGRLALDAPIGIHPPGTWSHRFRLSLFARGAARADLPSTVIAAGPFGDVKNYGGGRLYVSWYPVGLRAVGEEIEPPAVPPLSARDASALADEVIAHVSQVIPGVSSALTNAAEVRVEGGWVYAVGTGSLADASATLHRRDRAGIQQRGTYLSVDTGKYSIGPWLAAQIVARIRGLS